jgi:hypothetical protein
VIEYEFDREKTKLRKWYSERDGIIDFNP